MGTEWFFLFFARGAMCCVLCRRLEPFYSKEGEPWLSGPAAYPLKLLAFWSVQACWAWMVLLPVTVSQAAAPMAVMGPWGWAGAAAFFSFWAFEAGGARTLGPTIETVHSELLYTAYICMYSASHKYSNEPNSGPRKSTSSCIKLASWAPCCC